MNRKQEIENEIKKLSNKPILNRTHEQIKKLFVLQAELKGECIK